eukprot:15500_1
MNMSTNDEAIISTMKSAGYDKCVKISTTLQGSIWRAIQTSSGQKVVIKVTDRNLHKQQMVVLNGHKIKVHENIKKEGAILKYLAEDASCPRSVIKRLGAFKSNRHYFLVMEDGGTCLFDFVVRIHQFLNTGALDMAEWHKLVRIILKQMIECIEYIHSKKIAHFDISLENFLMNDVDVTVDRNNKITFCIDDKNAVQIKLCDFGLAEVFEDTFESNKFCGKPSYQCPEISSKLPFLASKNDVWCLGTCFWMMMIGTAPFTKTTETDERFKHIMNGNIVPLLTAWDRAHYVNKQICKLFEAFFQYEDKRVSLAKLKKAQWIKNTKPRRTVMACITA